MKTIFRFLLKVILTVIFLAITLTIMTDKASFIKYSVLLIFFFITGNIWRYKPTKFEVENMIIDYYKTLNINTKASNEEIQNGYDNEIHKLNNTQHMDLRTKKEILDILNDALNTLINPESKSKYNDKYFAYLEEVKQVEIKNNGQKFNLLQEIKNMLTFNNKGVQNLFYTLIAIGIIAFILEILA